MRIEDIRGAVARGWCEPGNTHKVLDPHLAEAISQQVDKLFRDNREPQLGCATTLQLLEELKARAEISDAIGEKWPSYRTIDN